MGKGVVGVFLTMLGIRAFGVVVTALGGMAPWIFAMVAFSGGELDEVVMGSVLALFMTGVGLLGAYLGLGLVVDSLVRRLLALAAGAVTKELRNRPKAIGTGAAELVVAAALVAALIGFVADGLLRAMPVSVVIGLMCGLLAGIHAASGLVWLRLAMRLRKGRLMELDQEQQMRGGELAGVFVGTAIIGLSMSLGAAEMVPRWRYTGHPRPLPYGEWVDGCVAPDESYGCEHGKEFLIRPRRKGPSEVEVVGDWDGEMQARLVTNDDSASVADFEATAEGPRFRIATFEAQRGTTYRLQVTGKGGYNLRFRSVR